MNFEITRRSTLLLGLLLLITPQFGLVAADENEKPKKVESALVIMTPMDIASVAVLDETSPAHDAFIEWVKPVFQAVETQFAKETKKRTVVVQVTLHPDREADVAVAGRPAPTDEEIKAIRKLAHGDKAPRSRIVDCVFRISTKINGGDPDEEKPLSPELELPGEQRLAEFRAASAPERLAALKRWARTEAIPLMAEIATGVNPKYEGVRNVGKALKALSSKGAIDIAALTDKNPDYWRAMLEMAPGIPLIPAVQVVLHTANGEINAARRVAQTFAPFDRHQSAYSVLLSEFTARANVFLEDIEGRIRKGIALNDAGQFDKALEVYDGVLKDYPQSPWAHYERFQTVLTQGLQAKNAPEKTHADWAKARKAILKADPLYTSMAEATSPDELYDLLLRKQIDDLFKDKTKTIRDLLRYADIALDLGQPGFAAMIYWNLVVSVKPKEYDNRELVEHVLYCLEQLGAREIKQNFKGDHAAEFKRIDAERARRRSESPLDRAIVPKKEP